MTLDENRRKYLWKNTLFTPRKLVHIYTLHFPTKFFIDKEKMFCFMF